MISSVKAFSCFLFEAFYREKLYFLCLLFNSPVNNELSISGLPLEITNNKNFAVHMALAQQKTDEFKQKFYQFSEVLNRNYLQSDINWKIEAKLSSFFANELSLVTFNMAFPADANLQLLSTSKRFDWFD